MSFVKTAHKWLSLVIGLQLAIWLASGLAFALLDSSIVSGRHLAERQAAQAIAPQQSLLSHAEIARRLDSGAVFSIRLQPGLDRPVYRVETAEGIQLRDARSGGLLAIDATTAADIAARDYAGDDSLVGEPVMLESATMETRGHSGPIWRVDVADEFGTTLYISAGDGRILERRNDSWRLFDIFWMLHIMDYTERQDFNNPFVIAFGIGALLMAISGCLLLFSSFSRHDFNLVAKLRRSKVAVTLLDRAAAPVQELALPSGVSLFEGLAANGVQLPSNCGGGGSCGLCLVQMPADTPVTGNEKALLSPSELSAGYRLACQQRASGATRLVLDDSVLQAGQFEAEVVESRFLTPFIKEIRLRPDSSGPFSFRAGSFVQVEIPPHQLRLGEMIVEPAYRDDWQQWHDTPAGAHGEPLRRSYSMASAPGEALDGTDGEGIISLNVRIQPPPPGQAAVPAGAGSSYMFNLTRGDRVQLSGPFGSFHASDNDREMILIGGGAGMAPLRSIIVDQLRNRGSRRRIHFWYGARSLREVFYRDLFDTLAAEHPNFHWHLGLSEPHPDDRWSGPTGYISDIAAEQYLRGHQDLDECEFYLCGPPAMLKASIAMLTALGVPREQIAFDDFGC
ncbi:NADH:ubiquinone reductase (Na(+)-transporting) subunit F [Microbulbifer sp. YPW16]|uniref:NADH:ubiquinone reductase (Na(+)-transporting) subunit F n=1 Tax=Microbulbifer sp. YPW16 TaxID=2904242 RepID=UPI001E2E112E|nr:NADH:ubiquinone reductase (Na(+)-transporting) subunit F [Microbulbifer sp. YPW16]UHQ56784.1 NADH:ubiquinone reductase (Na(+)-transporting) subunit F [Microbulbifer sp. YPW16]